MNNTAAPIEPWEIWHARFDFSEGKGYKYRPVLVLAMHRNKMLAAMITSMTNKLELPHDCPIANWAEAGLEKPSLVRLDRMIEIPCEYVGTQQRIGRLADKDIDSITLRLSSMT